MNEFKGAGLYKGFLILVGVSINGTHDRTSLPPVCADNI
jgi:hypothetical protein